VQTEVETAVRERLPIMTILLNNSRMGGYDHHMPAASARFRPRHMIRGLADIR